jgi:hypothetical protein
MSIYEYAGDTTVEALLDVSCELASVGVGVVVGVETV